MADGIDWSAHIGSCRVFYAERRCTCGAVPVPRFRDQLANAGWPLGTTVETVVLNGYEIPIVVEPDFEERGAVTWTWRGSTAFDLLMSLPPRAIRLRNGVDDLDGRVLLHEVLHALVGTDPLGVMPLDDPRHEDFVRMLTAGLHDVMRYRRAAALTSPATAPRAEEES